MRLRRRNRVMLITGASGFLGRHLTRGRAADEWQMIAPTSRSMDITNREFTLDTITGWKPDAVVHLAYRKGDRRVTVDGSRHVAEAAAASGSRLIHMSSDAVFAGRPAPYVESDDPDPITEYGRQKADAERAVHAILPGATIIRTSLLYGTDHPAPFQDELARALHAGRSPMTFFRDEFRCPAHADDVAVALAKTASQPDLSGVLNVAGPEAVNRADFAHALAGHAGFVAADLAISTIAESGMTRPGRVVLDTSLARSLGLGCRSLSTALTT